MAFGRKGTDTLAGVPQSMSMAEPQAAVIASTADYEFEDEGERVGLIQGLGFGALALIIILILESIFSSTSLITPINGLYLNAMRVLGAVAGVVLWLWARTQPNFAENTTFRKIMVMLGMPLFGLVMFDGFAWRIADNYFFAFSSAPWEQASYPIKGSHHGRKGARDTVSIDPFQTHESADIPVPSEQYRELGFSTEGLCVAVMQRRSPSGAVEIRTDGRYNLSTPERAQIGPCTATS